MRAFWNTGGGIERELRAARPEPREAFVDGLVRELSSTTPRRSARPRYAVALALVVAMAAMFATFGGFGYAANAVSQAVKTIAPAYHVNGPTPASSPSDSQYGKACGQPDGGPKKPNQQPCPPQAGH